MSNNYNITYLYKGYNLDIEIDVREELWLNHLKDLEPIIKEATCMVLDRLDLIDKVKNIEYCLILADNKLIRDLNAKYRGKDKPTNCLTFPNENLKPGKLNKRSFLNNYAVLGDIIFSYAIMAMEVEEQKKNFNNHFTHLLIHSLLHFFGYDHQKVKDALLMETIEIELLKLFNIESPYNLTY